MVKIQQFFIFKLESDRLKEFKFNIEGLTIEQARLNGELVSISNSEIVRTIYRVQNREFSQFHLEALLSEKKKISNRKNSKENRELLEDINKRIDGLLFIPEIVSILFKDKRHYSNILNKNGFVVNGIRYVPFMASAGMVRRDTSLFISSDIKKEVMTLFENDRDKTVEIVPAKYSAYYSLYSSSTIPVSFPRIAVVPDFLMNVKRKVDFSTYMGKDVDPNIEEREMELECNAFDGEGLCSPKMARKWASDLETDYIPSIFGIRAPFLKGMLCVFDFHKFASEIAKTNIVKDIYGDEIDIREVDCIISESQFKLWNSYKNTKDYVDKCKKNKLSFGITKVNPEKEKNHARTSYQFLQVLDLEDTDIQQLCKPTLNWLAFVSGGDLISSLLYSLGEVQFSRGWFNKLDSIIQALLLENSLLKDSYFINHFDKNIAKKKNDARIGRLIFNGNYQVMVSDPYYFCVKAFGLDLEPLLKDGEHFSKYWQEREKRKVVAIRSPIVHSSEVNVLNIQYRKDTDEWFKYITNAIIYPANGIGMDSALHGGSDFDLDLICTLDSPEMEIGREQGLPIFYESKKMDKKVIDDDTQDLVTSSQISQIGKNKIGFFTNVSSSLYSVLYSFEKGTTERNKILQRLKYGRVLQGLAIDSTKGLLVDPFPEHFVKWKKIDEKMTEEEKEYWELNNRILARKRPYFMRFLYSHYNRKFLAEVLMYDNVSLTKWGMNMKDLALLETRTQEQQELLDKYKQRSFFIDNDSTMNRISKYVDEKLRDVKRERVRESKDFDYHVLLSSAYKRPLKRDLDKMLLLFKEWKSLKRSFKETHYGNRDQEFNTIEQILKHINRKAYITISSNSRELADIAVTLCYNQLGKNSKAFCWQVFSKELVDNIKDKKEGNLVNIPIPSPDGDIDYLWSKYKVSSVSLEN